MSAAARRVVEAGQLHDHLHARPDRERREAIGDREQAGGRAAGRTGAGHVANVPAGRRLQEVRVVGEVGVEPRDHAPGRRPSAGRRRPPRPRSPTAGWSRPTRSVSATSRQHSATARSGRREPGRPAPPPPGGRSLPAASRKRTPSAVEQPGAAVGRRRCRRVPARCRARRARSPRPGPGRCRRWMAAAASRSSAATPRQAGRRRQLHDAPGPRAQEPRVDRPPQRILRVRGQRRPAVRPRPDRRRASPRRRPPAGPSGSRRSGRARRQPSASASPPRPTSAIP